MFESILHQTLQDKGNPDYVENNGPFPVKDSKNSYLGNGYYFWDDHEDLAHWWGEVHCEMKYIICESVFTIEDNDFCDLIGRRGDMKHLQQMIDDMDLRQLNMGQIVEYLREIDRTPGYKGSFPYKAIRAIDLGGSKFPEMIYKFAGNKKGVITLTPRILVCLFAKDTTILQTFKIIFPEDYIN